MSHLRPYGTRAQQAADLNARGKYGWRELEALKRANADAVARAMTETSDFGRIRAERERIRAERAEREERRKRSLRAEITEFLGLYSKSSEELERLRNHLKLVLGDNSGHMLTF